MDNRNKHNRQYSGTKGLSLAVVLGVALGTLIGKLLDQMNIGLMIGLVLSVCVWTLLVNRRPEKETPAQAEKKTKDAESDSAGGDDTFPE